MTLSLAACSQASPDPAPALESTAVAAATTAAPAEAKAGCEQRAGHREHDPAKLVQRLDLNHDGVLEVSELPEHKRQWLSAADSNKDGKLSVEELAQHKGGKFGRKDPAAFVARFDANGNGALEVSELPEHKRERFSGADTNKDQKLSVDELKTHFERRADEHRRARENSATQVM